jgi:anti-sigma regulatory factor (Ser/Thr protein kinase)
MGDLQEPSWRWSERFSAGRAGPVEARRWLQDLLDRIHDGVDQQAALLLLTELVTNAVLHGRAQSVRVDVELTNRTLEVGVSDDEPSPPRVRERGPDDEGGMGMMLVDRLANRWGVAPVEGGKRVWFDLGRRR